MRCCLDLLLDLLNRFLQEHLSLVKGEGRGRAKPQKGLKTEALFQGGQEKMEAENVGDNLTPRLTVGTLG